MKKTKMFALAIAAFAVAFQSPVFANGNTPAKSTKQTKAVSTAGSEKMASAKVSSTDNAPKTKTEKPTHSAHVMHKSHSKTTATANPRSSKGKAGNDVKKSGKKS